MKEAGSMKGAALLLDITYHSLRGMIHQDPDLRARYTHAKKKAKRDARELDQPLPEDMVELGRKPGSAAGTPVLASDALVARALEEEDQNLKDGLENLGLSPAAIQSAEALQQFHHSHFTKAVEIIGGGMTKTFLEIMAEVEAINSRLADGGLTLEEEQMLRQDRSRLLEIQGRTYDRAQKASMTQAVIQYKLSENAQDHKKSRGKPGFRPIVNAIKVESPGEVKVTLPTEAPEAAEAVDI